jgi:hypothetical protein
MDSLVPQAKVGLFLPVFLTLTEDLYAKLKTKG